MPPSRTPLHADEKLPIHHGCLYGLFHSNRQGKNLWGKNQFNSTFPTALACYMRDQRIDAVYVKVTENLKTRCATISIDELFNTDICNENLFFDFESRHEPFQKLVEHNLERVDLVIRTLKNGKKDLAGDALRALEIKLTVIPDSTTCNNSPDNWFPEMVIRPATIMYCAMSMASGITQEQAKEIFNPVGKNVRQWGNGTEALQLLPKVLTALNQLQERFLTKQQPIILQPIWRTQGKRPVLDDSAFDIFVWSDHALVRVVLDIVENNPGELSRFARSILRIARYLYEYGRAGTAHMNNIFSDMTYGHQSDKEFSLGGTITQRYMNHSRMGKPVFRKEVIRDIILDGGEEHLSPERRLDQTIYFAYRTGE